MPPDNISETGPGAGHAPFQLLFDSTTASKREFLMRKHIHDSEPPSSLQKCLYKVQRAPDQGPFLQGPITFLPCTQPGGSTDTKPLL